MAISAKAFGTHNPANYQAVWAAGTNYFNITATSLPLILLMCKVDTGPCEKMPVYDVAGSSWDPATKICRIKVILDTGGTWRFIPIFGGNWPLTTGNPGP